MEDKKYCCIGCGKVVRVKSVSDSLVVKGLCPQCYTKMVTLPAFRRSK